MQITDIRIYKTTLRNKYKQMRRDMPPSVKVQHDDSIRRRVQSLYQYKNAKTLLTFVSTDIEVDTRILIADALKNGKRVAVPRCIDGTREMEFYLIKSLDDLTLNAASCLPISQTAYALFRGLRLILQVTG